MFSSFTKKKLSDNQVANVFINGIFDSVDNGFAEVAEMINEDSAFVTRPNIPTSDSGQFGLIVIVGNLRVGGTGKTPIVIALAERLRARGRRGKARTWRRGNDRRDLNPVAGDEAGPILQQDHGEFGARLGMTRDRRDVAP